MYGQISRLLSNILSYIFLAIVRQGYLSYPRTESSGYPTSFDFKEVLSALGSRTAIVSTPWGEYASTLLQRGVSRPQGGVDVGDHPPITPCRLATEDSVGGGDAWRMYE